MALQQDVGSACLTCASECPGFKLHSWRATCTNCHCFYDKHDVTDSSKDTFVADLQLADANLLSAYNTAQITAKENGLTWLPIGVLPTDIDAFLASLPSTEVPRGKTNAEARLKRIRRQIPPQDREPAVSLKTSKLNLPASGAPTNLDGEVREATRFQNSRNRRDFGLGRVERVADKSGITLSKRRNSVNHAIHNHYLNPCLFSGSRVHL
uniref:Four and a half LIM domains protein 2 n=1 Tax=Mesocestoides corti TaxID=53468 RepID=A0A5K3EYW6_MESCO